MNPVSQSAYPLPWCYVNPLAGGGNITTNPSPLWSENPFTNGAERWTTARVVRVGLRVIPSANITIKQGMLTAGILPGRTLNLGNLTGSTANTIYFKIPTAEALR